MISILSPDGPYKVVTQEEWWSDSFDATHYAAGYDPTTDFFSQMKSLNLRVPHQPLASINAENSDYVNFAINVKDCYLVYGTVDAEGCLYCKAVSSGKDVLDGLALRKCDLCYEGIASEGCYECSHFTDCKSCTNCFFIEACESCKNCALCFGLHRKEYHILNKPVSKAAYEAFIATETKSRSKVKLLKQKFEEFSSTFPRKASYIQQSENCSGNFIANSRNCHYAFDVTNCDESKFIFWVPNSISSHDCSFGAPVGVELCYQTCSTMSTRSMGTFLNWYNDRVFYSIECHKSKNLLGCIGLKSIAFSINSIPNLVHQPCSTHRVRTSV